MFTNKVFDTKYKLLNTRQKEAVDTIYGPVMVVAGPGTGKTHVLTMRIANILKKSDAKPEEILALTFTKNGAKNMREKLREIIGDRSFKVNIFTFHAFANHMRFLFPECFGEEGDRTPADEAAKLQILEAILEKQSFRELRVSTFGVNLRKISGRISDLKRELVTPKDLKKLIAKKKNSLNEEEKDKKEKYFVRIGEFAEVYELYEKEMSKRALYDFDDAILGLVETLKSHPDMAAEMRERFQFVLADEHQDANGAQNEILKMFRVEGVDSPNIFVVGDDKQSIFRFQGASLEHFYNFSKEFDGAKKITLVENYRSHKIILDASHSLITADGKNHQKLRANVSYREKKIELIEYPDYEAELIGTARAVKRILKERGSVEEIAIIARNNKVLFDIAPYLEAEEVKFKISGERSLFENHEYRRLMYLFEAISNPYEGALLKALYAGYFGADVANVIALATMAKKERKDFASLYLLTSEGKRIKDLIAQAKKTEVAEFLKILKSEMRADLERGTEALRAIFDEVKSITKKNRSATLDDLITHLEFLEAHNLTLLDDSTDDDVSVELLSIHKAKGLEYEYVFVVDATARRFEGSKNKADLLHIPNIGHDTELEEERRLLYVALTRAKKHASISYSLSGGEEGNSGPSILLSEMNPSFFDKKVCSHKVDKPDMFRAQSKMTSSRDKYREVFLKRNFSVSALNNFIKCPWRYFFRNLLLLPEPPEFSSNLGNACHQCLRVFHTNAKKGKLLSKGELKKLVSQCIYNEPFTSSELPVALERATKSIEAYTKTFIPFSDKEKVYVEDSESFIYRMKSRYASFEVTLTGKIDLAREKDNEIQVIDFKTKKRMTRNEIEGKTKNSSGNEIRQLQFYKFLLENTRKGISVSSGTLTFLSPEKGKVLSETFDLDFPDAQKIEEALSQALLSIYNLDFWDKTCSEKDCEYCELSKLLPR